MAVLWLNKMDLIVRQEDQGTDFGSDLELELHDDSSVTGHIVKCQVKSTERLRWSTAGTFDVSINSATQNYWVSLPVNVICLLVDVTDSAIYWQVPSASLASSPKTSIRFRSLNRADSRAQDFEGILNRLATTPTDSQILAQVAPCLNLFSSISLQSEAVYDRGFEVEPEVDASIRILYHHVERLCIYTGADEVPAPWIHWERRNEIMQTLNDSGTLGRLEGNVAVEVVRYMSTFYETALARIVDCIDAHQLIDSIPQLAALELSHALSASAVEASFRTFRSSGEFRIPYEYGYSFAREADDQDVAFDHYLNRWRETLQAW